MAIVAAGALVLSGCTSDTEPDEDGAPADTGAEDDEPDEPAEPEDEDESTATGGMDEDGSTATEDMEGEASADTEKPDLDITETKDDNIFYSVGQDEWSGYNANTSGTNSVYNSVISSRLQEGFWYFGTDGTVYPNEDFGTYEKTSDDPLTVEYTISDEAVWADGTPVTYNDFLLEWASQNPATIFGAAGVGGEEGEEGEEEEEPAEPLFDNVGDSMARYIPEGPEGELGSKEFTVVYAEPNPDWQIIVGGAFPAHVAAEQSGLEPDALAQAILDRDAATVEQVAEFWNTGWLSPDQTMPDPMIALSNGPYSVGGEGAEWNTGQYLTLGPNENYYGPPPATSNLTFRFAAPETHVQGLQNGDINIIEPQATVDTVAQIQGMGDQFTLLTSDDLTWEHLDFNFAEGSPFAEAEGGLAAREAFAMCVPRQQIIDNLIAPINDEAVVMNSREYFPFQEEYQEVVDASYEGQYDEVDIEGAMAKLEEAGLETPVEVRIGYSAPNQRRTDEVALIKSSCDQAGFNITDSGDPDFFQPGGALEVGDWEIALFAWAGSGQIGSGQAIYETDGNQNYGGYSNATVDEAWEAVNTSVDPEVHLEQKKIIEKQLWDDLYGIPVFAFPGVVAHDATIENVINNSSQTGIAWNAEQWVRGQ